MRGGRLDKEKKKKWERQRVAVGEIKRGEAIGERDREIE